MSPVKPNALVASAKVLTAERLNQPKTAAWQEECWGHYDLQGELWFAALWLQNALSKMRLFAATPPQSAGDEPEPIEIGPAVDLMEAFAGGVQGQGAVLSSMVVHLTVPGEGFLLGRTDDEETSWRVCSNDELKVTKNVWQLKIDAKTWETLPEESLPIRVWRPHARRAWLADSPTRHALGALREIQRCNEHIDATLVSRLAGSGLLIMPNEVSFPHTEASEGKDDPFFWELLEAMRAPIKDRGVAGAVVPLPVRVPGDQVANFKHLTFATQLDEKVLALRVNAIERFATTVDFPAEILLGKQDSNHWCSAADTEALTPSGWVRHDELRVGSVIRALDHETGLACWTDVKDIYRADVIDEPMVSIEGFSHSSLTTRNHRWPVLDGDRRKWATSEKLRERHRLTTGAPGAGFLEPKYSDALVELVAWFWTEGSISGSGVSIAQSHTVNAPRVALIRAALTTLYGPALPSLRRLHRPGWREKVQLNAGSHGGPVTVFYLNAAAAAPLLEAAPAKRVLSGFIAELTSAQLELFIDRSLQGDGWHYRRGQRDIFARDLDMLDGLEIAGVLAGYTTTVRATPGGWRLNLSAKPTLRPVKAFRAGRRLQSDAAMRIGEVSYTGTIWCPVTRHGTWLARRRGTVYYTGNTSWQISEEGLQLHIEPVTEMICDAFTKGYLKPALASIGDDTDAMIWYDASELAVRPDRSADAKWLLADAVIGPHAAIRETGFTEADRPTTEEFEQMVGWKLLAVRGGAALALSLLKVDFDPALLPPDEGGTGPVSPVQSGQDPGLVGPDTPGPDSPGTKPPSPIQGPPSAGPPSGPGPDLPSQAATLLVADQLVYRALERAGNRLRSLRKGKLTADEDCPPASMHQCLDWRALGIKPAELLEGAWARVPKAAEGLGEDPVKMQRALQRYCVQLYEMGKQGGHSVERLAEFLADELPQTIGTLAGGDGMQMALVREMSRTMGRLAETMAHQPPPVTNVTVVAPSGEVRESQTPKP